MDQPDKIDELLQAAYLASKKAYCQYSGYAVGAAVLTAEGKIAAGCNVENVSYGLTVCAERNAIAAAVAGCEQPPLALVALALVTGPLEEESLFAFQPVPCGACLQVFAEFAGPRASIICGIAESDRYSEPRIYRLSELLPVRFGEAPGDES